MKRKNPNSTAAPLTDEGRLKVERGFEIAYRVYGSRLADAARAPRRPGSRREVPHASQRGHRRRHQARPLRPARRRRVRLARRPDAVADPALHRRGRDRAHRARARHRHALRPVVGRHARAGLHARPPGQRRRADPVEHVRLRQGLPARRLRPPRLARPRHARRDAQARAAPARSTTRSTRTPSPSSTPATSTARARTTRRGRARSSQAIAAEHMPEMGPAYALWGPHEFMGTGPQAHFDISDRLGEISVPALVLCGWYDELTPQRCSRPLADGIAGQRVRRVRQVEPHDDLRERVRGVPRGDPRLPRAPRLSDPFGRPLLESAGCNETCERLHDSGRPRNSSDASSAPSWDRHPPTETSGRHPTERRSQPAPGSWRARPDSRPGGS